MQKITPFLWFENEAEEAVNFYVSIFKNAKILKTTRHTESSALATGKPKDSVLTIVFQLDGQEFMALNGGPEYTFNPAVSMLVKCKTQKEIDDMWAKLTEGGKEVQCGWLEDKYGLSWQIVPEDFGEMVGDPDPAKAERFMKAMMGMVKLDMKKLKEAYDGKKAA